MTDQFLWFQLSNEQLQQQLEYTLLKAWLSQLVNFKNAIWHFRRTICNKMGRGQHSSNRVSGISTRTMHQSSTPSLSQTFWSRWASRQFITLPIVQTLLPVTFAYSLSSQVVVMGQLRRWKRLWRRSLTRSHKRTSYEAFQKLLERYNKCIAAGGDYFEGD